MGNAMLTRLSNDIGSNERTDVFTTIGRAQVLVFRDALQLEVLESGSHEALKAGVHVTALGLAVVMSLYNAAAWVRRREHHLALNAVVYTALTAWEIRKVTHHLANQQPMGASTNRPLRSV